MVSASKNAKNGSNGVSYSVLIDLGVKFNVEKTRLVINSVPYKLLTQTIIKYTHTILNHC